MRERREPAPLAPEPPRWPGPGLRPRLGPAAARAGGCPGGRGSGFGAGRAGPGRRGGAFPLPFRSVPAPQEGAPPGCGALRHGCCSTGRAALPSLWRVGRRGGSRNKWSASVPPPAALLEAARGAGRRVSRCASWEPRGGAVRPGRAGARAAVACLTERGRVRRICPGAWRSRSPPAGAGTAPREEGFGVRRNSPRCGVLLSPHGLTGSTVLELLSAAKQTPRAALRSSGGAASGAGRAPIATVRAVRERDPRAANRVRANFVRRILPLGRAAREEIT